MLIKNKYLFIIPALMLMTLIFLVPAMVSAERPAICSDPDAAMMLPECTQGPSGAQTRAPGDSAFGDRDADCSDSLDPEDCGIMRFIQVVTRALTALVGIVVVMMIVIGGIQYSSAGSNPQAVAAAKKKISQALLALAIYIFAAAFLEWLVPGGAF